MNVCLDCGQSEPAHKRDDIGTCEQFKPTHARGDFDRQSIRLAVKAIYDARDAGDTKAEYDARERLIPATRFFTVEQDRYYTSLWRPGDPP